MADLVHLNASKVAAPGRACVRITDPDRHGFVEFQFSLGDPHIHLEMTLPRPAFEQFCATHNARELSADEARAVDCAEMKWRYGDEE